ncbi:MAG TPA: isocitrate/isopropylmalate dehydrogenase family protein [Burkholderiales bacterium]|nr:isocitrate/isopropylmalate dehydrogenase family protein [Burkholderiales bacterium]
MHRVSLIPGDGIGPEVTHAARAVLEASGAELEFEIAVIGQEAEKQSGAQMPPQVWESFARTRLLLKGPTYTPFGGGFRVKVERPGVDGKVREGSYPSLAIALRKELGLYVNVRPIKTYPNVRTRYENVDLVIFRENSEDLYVGNERMIDADTAEGIKRITRGATERVAKFAYDYMKRTGRRKLTIGHKANVMKMTDGLWLNAAQEIGKGFPDITTDARVIDALCMELVIKPETFDGLLLTNLYGDIVSDLCAGLVGGLGVAPGANIGPDAAMFEAVHGTAPDIAGKDLANPMAMILSAVLMLRYIDECDAADRIDAALSEVLADKKSITRDLGGTAGTKAFTQAIVAKLKS